VADLAGNGNPPSDALDIEIHHAQACSQLPRGHPSGPAYITPISSEDGEKMPPFEVLCNMDTAGGGWTLVARVSGSDLTSMWQYGSANYWNRRVFGNCTLQGGAFADCKSPAYRALIGSQVLIEKANQASVWTSGGFLEKGAEKMKLESQVEDHEFAVHKFTDGPPLSWGQFLESLRGRCSVTISSEALELKSDGKTESVVGEQLVWGQFNRECRNPCTQKLDYQTIYRNCAVRAQLASKEFHFGFNAAGFGVHLAPLTTAAGIDYDAVSMKEGTLMLMYSTRATPEDYSIYIRMPHSP